MSLLNIQMEIQGMGLEAHERPPHGDKGETYASVPGGIWRANRGGQVSWKSPLFCCSAPMLILLLSPISIIVVQKDPRVLVLGTGLAFCACFSSPQTTSTPSSGRGDWQRSPGCYPGCASAWPPLLEAWITLERKGMQMMPKSAPWPSRWALG